MEAVSVHDQGYHIKIKRGQRRTGTLMWVMVMVVVMAVTHGNNLPVFVFPKGRTRKTVAQKIQARH